LPDRLVSAPRAAKARQAAERLALGGAGAFDYVVTNEVGKPYSPAVLSRYWRDRVKAAGVRHIKLHGARYTCATLTMKLYVHSQDEALKAAGATLNRTTRARDMA
jgi:integrase